MLNIRISFNVNLRKTWRILAVCLLAFSHAITSPSAEALTTSVIYEKPVTVNLTHLNMTTTVSQAKLDLASNGSKYFDAEALAFLTTYTQGWKISDWKCLRNLWQHESHFNPKALNMSSGALGIAQFLPTTWGNYKVDKTLNAKLQIQYGLRYIEKRYGSVNDKFGACNAWAFWSSRGWY
jgi:Transglycosylase SLT domain